MLRQVMVGNSFILRSHRRKFRDSRSHLETMWSIFIFFIFLLFYFLERLRFKKDASTWCSWKKRRAEAYWLQTLFE